jgi:hypothetical protein
MDKIIRVKEKTYGKIYKILTNKRDKQFQDGNYDQVSFDEIINELLERMRQ